MHLFDVNIEYLEFISKKENTEEDFFFSPPNFYTVVNNKSKYDYVLIHYYLPCNEIELTKVKNYVSKIVIQFESKNENYDCVGFSYPNQKDVVRIYNPLNKPYQITVDSSEYKEKTIQPFNKVIEQIKTNQN